MQPLNCTHCLTPEQSRALESLLERLSPMQPGVIAVSGGLDSRFLAHIAAAHGLDFLALLFSTPLTSESEQRAAEDTLQRLGLPFIKAPLNPLHCKEVAENRIERCYHCKRLLFSQAAQMAADRKRDYVLEGTHADDLKEHRPGVKALRELSIQSPLADTGLGKADIRELSRSLGIPHPDQPSRPCLLTRFAYGCSPTRDELARVGSAEEDLRRLGLESFRIRILPDKSPCLQIASPAASLEQGLKESIAAILGAYSLWPSRFIHTDTLSGFFDGQCRSLSREP